MKRFGVSSVSRWLSEELPQGVTAYIECHGQLFELLQVVACSGKLSPTIRTVWRGRNRERTPRMYVTLDTPVILSLGESLEGVRLETIEGDLAPAASNSWALNDYSEVGVYKRRLQGGSNDIAGLHAG